MELDSIHDELVEGYMNGTLQAALVLGHSCSGLEEVHQRICAACERRSIPYHSTTRSRGPQLGAPLETGAAEGDTDASAIGMTNHDVSPSLTVLRWTEHFPRQQQWSDLFPELDQNQTPFIVVLNTDMSIPISLKFVSYFKKECARRNMAHRIVSFHSMHHRVVRGESATIDHALSYLADETNNAPTSRMAGSVCALRLVPSKHDMQRFNTSGMVLDAADILGNTATPRVAPLRTFPCFDETVESISTSIKSFLLSMSPQQMQNPILAIKHAQSMLQVQCFQGFSLIPIRSPPGSEKAACFLLRCVPLKKHMHDVEGIHNLMVSFQQVGWNVQEANISSLDNECLPLPPLTSSQHLRLGSRIYNPAHGIGWVVGFHNSSAASAALQNIEWPIIRYESSKEEPMYPVQQKYTSHITGVEVNHVSLPALPCFAVTPQRLTKAARAITAANTTPSQSGAPGPVLSPVVVCADNFIHNPTQLRFALRYSHPRRTFIYSRSMAWEELRRRLSIIGKHVW